MAAFLTDEWFAAAERLELAVPDAADLELDQHVWGAPSGEHTYRVSLRHGRIRVDRRPPPDRPPDVTVSLSYDTAVALRSGRADATVAFRAGNVRITGDLSRLGPAGPALAALAEALAGVGGPEGESLR